MTQVNGGNRALTDDEREWLRVRAHLRQHRYELAVSAAAELYPDVPRAAGTPLLTSASWMPSEPIPLQDIALGLSLDTSPTFAVPARADGGSPRYSDLVCRLAKPAVFENRPTYRLLGADLHGVPSRMDFGLGHYFDGVDTGEALAHEYAAEKLGKPVRRFQRDAIGNPTDVTRRPTNLAISALTIRRDRAAGRAEFLLHWRDPAKVGHAGGLYQVIPVGIFQPATDHPDSVRNDFSLRRCLLRELAEELLGHEEIAPDGGPIDYEAWPLAAELGTAHQQGAFRVSCLGMGVDPLTLATDLLCVVVIDAPVFDRVFAELVIRNDEGDLAGLSADRPGLPFVADQVERLSRHEPVQAAGAAVLALAWRHRASLLAP